MSEAIGNSFTYEPKEFVEEPFYSVAEAMRLTGLSSTKFRYEPNKRELDARGADLSDRVWRIPRSVLIDMGWLSPDAPITSHIGAGDERGSKGVAVEVRNLRSQIQDLLAQVSERDTQLAVANATIRAKDAEITNLMSLLHDRKGTSSDA